MSSWEEKFRIMKEKPTFCRDLTQDIENDNVRNEEFFECMLNPLKYVERKYKDELCTFGRTDDPNLNDLLECKKTEKIINLMAKEKENPTSSYEINREEGIKNALEDLEDFKNKDIDIIKPKEKREHFEIVESCLPTESYVLQSLHKKIPKSEPSAGEGKSIIRILRSLLSKKPKKISENIVRPRTAAVTHQFQHKKEKFDHLEHLKKDWNDKYFEELKNKKRIQKKG